MKPNYSQSWARCPRHRQRLARALEPHHAVALRRGRPPARRARAHAGPLVCRTGHHTGRSPNDKFVVRDASTADRVWWGKVNRPIAPRTSTPCTSTCSPTSRARNSSCRTATRARTRLPAAHSRDHRERVAQPLRASHVHPRARSDEARAAPPGVHGHRHATLPRRPGRARHQLRVYIIINFARVSSSSAARATPARSRVDLHGDELPAAVPAGDADALLGERRCRRRHGALLRLSGTARRRCRATRTAG